MASKMMDCDEATFLMSVADQRKLSCRERISMNVHKMTCKFCGYYDQQIKAVNKRIATFKAAHSDDHIVFTLSDKEKEELKRKLE